MLFLHQMQGKVMAEESNHTFSGWTAGCHMSLVHIQSQCKDQSNLSLLGKYNVWLLEQQNINKQQLLQITSQTEN